MAVLYIFSNEKLKRLRFKYCLKQEQQNRESVNIELNHTNLFVAVRLSKMLKFAVESRRLNSNCVFFYKPHVNKTRCFFMFISITLILIKIGQWASRKNTASRHIF